ncbi:MAG: hypothetical protein AAGH83_02035 [Pseudomonadota bacterium]
MASGALSLWLLTQILSKEAIGGYLAMFSITLLASLLATLGLDRALLLRIAPRPTRQGVLRGAGMWMRVTAVAILAGIVVAIGLNMLRLAFFPDSAVAQWMPVMSLAIPIAATSLLLRSWFEANHRAATAHAMPGIVDASRCLLFVLLLFAGLGANTVAWCVVAAVSIPIFVLGILSSRQTRLIAPKHLTAGDFGSGAQRVVERMAMIGLFQIDLIIMGLLLVGSAMTAEYGIAARLAAFVGMGTNALDAPFAARARRYIVANDIRGALHEFETARVSSLAVALTICSGVAVLGPFVLSLFGDYGGSFAPLLMISSSYIILAAFGAQASFLAMTGEVTYSMILRVVTIAVLTALLIYAIPRFGVFGAAASLLIAVTGMSIAGATLAARLTELRVIDVHILIIAGISVVILWATAFGHIGHLVCGAALACAAIWLIVSRWQVLVSLLRNVEV